MRGTVNNYVYHTCNYHSLYFCILCHLAFKICVDDTCVNDIVAFELDYNYIEGAESTDDWNPGSSY
jgi:hypothetical protein